MQKSDFLNIRQQLSFEKPLWITLAVIAFDVFLLWLAFYLITSNNIIGYIAGSLLLAIVYFHNFALLHEAGHGNIHKKRWINIIVGHYASTFCFLPYYPWQAIHQEHHTWTGNIEKDPTLKHIKDARKKGSILPILNFCWRSWVPLAAFAQHFVFWMYPYTLFKNGQMTSKRRMQSIFSVTLLISSYVFLAYAFPAYVNWSNLWLSFVIYLMIVELVNFPHHISMPTYKTGNTKDKLHPWEQHVTTRTCYYPKWIARLITLNFNLHIEHHFFPNLPWYRLDKLRDIIKPLLNNEYHEEYGINWNLKNRARDGNEILLHEATHPLLEPSPHA